MKRLLLAVGIGLAVWELYVLFCWYLVPHQCDSRCFSDTTGRHRSKKLTDEDIIRAFKHFSGEDIEFLRRQAERI